VYVVQFFRGEIKKLRQRRTGRRMGGIRLAVRRDRVFEDRCLSFVLLLLLSAEWSLTLARCYVMTRCGSYHQMRQYSSEDLKGKLSIRVS
jgi:hypothetical protein